MSTNTKSGRTELWISRGCQDAETSVERPKFWEEPKMETAAAHKAAVVYYLSRNGQLEHPHFIEVPLLSPQGLYLRGNQALRLRFFLSILLFYMVSS